VYEELPPLNVEERTDDWPLSRLEGVADGAFTISIGLTTTVRDEVVCNMTGEKALSVTEAQ